MTLQELVWADSTAHHVSLKCDMCDAAGLGQHQTPIRLGRRACECFLTTEAQVDLDGQVACLHVPCREQKAKMGA
jgi:hypothetical protein